VTETVIATPTSALPQWNGRPVPWITRWTGEVSSESLQVSIDREGVHLNYPDGNEDRDEFGVLWKREGIGRGGEPQYSQVNTYRQRLAMRRRRCQVCGSRIDERPIRWLMSERQLLLADGADPYLGLPGDYDASTISAPTCSACIPLAMELCPHLRNNPWVILKVLEYEPWGVYGEAVKLDREDGRGRDLRGVYVPYEDPPIELSAVVAFQLVVQFTKFVIEEEG
jgi:hypothetical protein